MAEFNVQAVLHQAVAGHQAGRLEEAETLYRQILSRFPQHFDALHMLGLLAFHSGRNDEAARLIGQAIGLDPNYAPCHSNLGNVLLAQGRADEAIDRFRRALALNPDFVEAHNNLGNALRDHGRLDEAAGCYNRALAIRPDFAEVHNNLGLVLTDRGLLDEAIGCYNRALAIRPDFAEAHTNLGMALDSKGLADQAMASLERALAISPDNPEAHNNMGNALKARNRLDDAVRSYRRALALRPGYADAHSNLGLVLAAQGLSHEALSSYDRALAIRPDFAEVQWNKGITLLLQGDFAAGWPLYEWRWKAIERRAVLPGFREPLWLGEVPIAGRTILLHHEQGLGDTLQTLRYVPLLARQGARVILQMPPVLAPLTARVAGVSEVVIEGQPRPKFDLQCPMMSLPLAFRTTLPSIPAEVPYLFAAESAKAAWGSRLGATARRRVGLAWSGSTSHSDDRNRSIALRRLLPLLDHDTEFHSLQIEYRPDDEALMRADGRIQDHSGELPDLGETAALIEQMDLLITIDTAVAHLAGGMGKPVWVMLPFAPDYRWMLHRTDSPWYPTLRLFRQPAFGDWEPVLRAVAAALAGQDARR